MLSDSDSTIRALVKKFMMRPETIVFVVEAATTEDYSTSHIAPLLK
jgi:hypothetical protein